MGKRQHGVTCRRIDGSMVFVEQVIFIYLDIHSGQDKLSVQLGINPTRLLSIAFFKNNCLKIFFYQHIFLKLLTYKFLILVMEETHRSKCFAQIL